MRLHRDRFTTRAEWSATGAWWKRTLIGAYMPPISISEPAFRKLREERSGPGR